MRLAVAFALSCIAFPAFAIITDDVVVMPIVYRHVPADELAEACRYNVENTEALVGCVSHVEINGIKTCIVTYADTALRQLFVANC